MKTLTTHELVTVAGGTTNNDQLATQLTALQSSIKEVATASTSNQTNPTMMMAMMMAMRPQAPQVIAAPAPEYAAAPIINISNRIRRW